MPERDVSATNQEESKVSSPIEEELKQQESEVDRLINEELALSGSEALDQLPNRASTDAVPEDDNNYEAQLD